VKRRRGYTRLSRKNQVTIPVAVLAQLGVDSGAEFRVEVDDGRIVLEPTRTPVELRREAIERAKGALTDVYEPGYLERLRDEWR
jgi:AbrB family looped-hinge helix DNA binding protein